MESWTDLIQKDLKKWNPVKNYRPIIKYQRPVTGKLLTGINPENVYD